MDKKILNRDECRKVEINILKEIDKICKENNLNYYICYGTLLGAVRHQGFIPWDDDIDIMLFRNDYDKLIELLKKQERCKWLDVLDLECDDYYYTFAKAVDNRTVAKMEDNITEHGLWVDIFPYDNYPDEKRKRDNFIMKAYYKRSIIVSMLTDFLISGEIEHKYIKRFLNIYSKLLNKKKFVNNYNTYCQKYRHVDTKYVGSLFTPYKLKECFEKKWFKNRKKYKFEDDYFYGPSMADEYLTQLYGNYMKLPPKKQRRDHKVIAWKK